MKDLGRTRFCLGLQIEHLKDGIFMHQSTYISKILKRFYMDKDHPLSTPMVVRSLETIKDPFQPKGNDEELLGPEVPYLSADSCHGRVSGINKICFLCSSYCRSQATAA